MHNMTGDEIWKGSNFHFHFSFHLDFTMDVKFVKQSLWAVAAEQIDPVLHCNQCWSILQPPASLSPRHASSSSPPDCYWSHSKTAPLNLFPFISWLWFLFSNLGVTSHQIPLLSFLLAVIPRSLSRDKACLLTTEQAIGKKKKKFLALVTADLPEAVMVELVCNVPEVLYQGKIIKGVDHWQFLIVEQLFFSSKPFVYISTLRHNARVSFK